MPVREGFQDIFLILSYRKTKSKVSKWVYYYAFCKEKKTSYILISISFPSRNTYKIICMSISELCTYREGTTIIVQSTIMSKTVSTIMIK